MKDTNYALNYTTKRAQGFIRDQLRKYYTVIPAYLKNASKITKYANSKKNRSYTETSFDYKTIPFTGFKYTGLVKGRRRPTVTIKKGTTIYLKHAFVKDNQTPKTGNKGIYAVGEYRAGKFVYDKTASGRKITQLKSASPFTMSTASQIRPKVGEYVNNQLPSRLKYLLQKRLDKMRNY